MSLNIVFTADYNGHKALFAMESDDYRISGHGYHTIGTLEKYGRNFVNTATGRVYKRFADWSLKEVSLSGAQTLDEIEASIA